MHSKLGNSGAGLGGAMWTRWISGAREMCGDPDLGDFTLGPCTNVGDRVRQRMPCTSGLGVGVEG